VSQWSCCRAAAAHLRQSTIDLIDTLLMLLTFTLELLEQ
jgi:hypothetical protein